MVGGRARPAAGAPATFGENLTIEGLESAALSIGDRLVAPRRHARGDVAAHPVRQLAARMDDKGFIRRFRNARRPGVYLRVVEPGEIGPGDEVAVERGPGTLTVLALQNLFSTRGHRWHRSSEPCASRSTSAPARPSSAADPERKSC